MTISLPSQTSLRPACQLIVLIPAAAPNSPDPAIRIWEIARSKYSNVTLLGLTNDFYEESQLRRTLITMAAIIKYPGLSTDIKIERGTNWLRQVKKIYREGDAVACFDGQKVGTLRKPLDQVLKTKMDVPIYLLPGYPLPIKRHSRILNNITSWTGSLTLIGGFLLAEQKIITLPQDGAQTILLVFFIIAELALLWLWNSFFP